jgi:hypothetical protein
MMRPSVHALLLIAVLAAGCGLMPGAGFVPGSTTQSEVRASLGAPGKTYPSPEGGESWAYPTAPMGEQTWMARFNARGVLVKFEQVLDQDHFSAIQRGMDGAQVGALIGPPGLEMRFDNLRQTSWDYRFGDTWGYVSVYSVMFGEDGKVASTFARRLNPGKDRD